MSNELVLIGCDDDMLALKEIFEVVDPDRMFCFAVRPLLEVILEDCQNRHEAAINVDLGWCTNWYMSRIMHIPAYPYHSYFVDGNGNVDTSNRLYDKRTIRQIIRSLAKQIYQHLAGYKLYDRHGNLRVRLAENVYRESLAIVLEKF